MPDAADPLSQLRIASPCSADWGAMSGDARKRFCQDCKLHVHDLGAMTRDEAMELLRGAGTGRLCVRFHRRADGKVLTRDCPVGLRRRLRWAWARAAALFGALWSGVACSQPSNAGVGAAQQVPAGQQPMMGSPGPVSAPTVEPVEPGVMGEAVMGDVEVLQGKVRAPDDDGNERR